MSIKSIVNLTRTDIDKMSEKELRKIVNETRKAVNQRISRLEKTEGGIYSPAYRMMSESGGRIKTAGKSVQELRSEFLRGQNFLNPETKTSTVKGFKEFTRKVSQKVQADRTLSGEEVKKLLDATAKIAELHPDIWTNYSVRAAMAERVQKSPNVRVSTLIKTGLNKIEEEYQIEQAERAARNAEFFGTVI